MEGNMVTNNEEQTTTVEPQAEVQIENVTQEPAVETTEQPIANLDDGPTESSVETPTQQVESPPIPETTTVEGTENTGNVADIQNQMTELQQTIQKQQEQLQYFNELDANQKAQQQASDYQRRLEEQGWMPEQAQTVAQNYVSQMHQSQQQQQRLQQEQEYRDGQRKASVFYVKKYNLGVDDITNLERFNNPNDMEVEAKRIKELRDTKAELNALKKAQVPPQQFDTNQPAASASGSEDELLDQYNSGVRNSQTEAAARRAAGFG